MVASLRSRLIKRSLGSIVGSKIRVGWIFGKVMYP